MYRNYRALLGALAIAALSVACSQSDVAIRTKVKENLTSDATLKSAQIDVGVQNKVVTLSGAVGTAELKQHAVAVARGTSDVADVVDQVAIQGRGPGFGPGREMMDKGMAEGKEGSEQEKRQGQDR